MSHTVWIIDDDNSIRWVLEKALARADILCESYASADLMLQRLEYDTPAVVVSDIRMPGTDGMALLSRLQELSPELPAMRAVGYRQAIEHLDGVTDAATFRDRAIFATRQLAKRQITWLRSEHDARAFEPDAPGLAAAVEAAVVDFIGRTAMARHG